MLDETDDESDSDESDEGFQVFALRKGPEPVTTPIKNSFEALHSYDDDNGTEDIVAELESWAHKVQKGKQSQKERKASVLLTEADLTSDAFLPFRSSCNSNPV